MAIPLWQAQQNDSLITLRCLQHREGLKSKPPCTVVPQVLHVPSLIAILSPDLSTDRLRSVLRCPRCGSQRVAVAVAQQTAEERVQTKMQPARRANTLGTTPEQWVVFRCPQCGRRGEYRRERLIEEFGPDIDMPSLLMTFAAARDCGLARSYLRRRDLTNPVECKIVYDIE